MRFLLAAVAAALLAGCNGLFYYPMTGTLTTPEALDLAYEDFFVPSDPGVRLHFWRIAAAGKRRGTVLQLHGNAENMTSHFLFVVWLAQKGYDVVAFDYRGYGESTGTATRRGLVDDARVALRVAAAKGGPIYVVAQSLGGAIAVPAIVEEHPTALKAVVLDSTFASYRSMARDKLAEHWFSWPLQWPLSFLVTDDWSPLDAASRFTWPVAVVHAPRDPVVPYAQGVALYAALGTKNKEFWNVDAAQHTYAFSDAADAMVLRERLVHFFEKWSG